jgi:hypothetical protein
MAARRKRKMKREKKKIDPNGISRLNLQITGALMIAILDAASKEKIIDPAGKAKPKALTVSSWVRKTLRAAVDSGAP